MGAREQDPFQHPRGQPVPQLEHGPIVSHQPMDAAAEILWFNGIVVVVSAGNNGSARPLSTGQ